MANVLKILDLQVESKKKKILKGLDLEINEGEIHLLLGPNGAGKTTLAKYLGGISFYKETSQLAHFLNFNLPSLSITERSKQGLFLSFQSPPQVSEIKTNKFLRILYNQKNIISPVKALEFQASLVNLLKTLHFDYRLLKRNLNQSFSGGERKMHEILQFLIIKPKLIILDEIDSGLDIDALKIIFKIIKKVRLAGTSFLIITHYTKFLRYLNATHVHLISKGLIKKTGSRLLLQSLERNGFLGFFRKNLKIIKTKL